MKKNINTIVNLAMLAFFVPCAYSAFVMSVLFTGPFRAAGSSFSLQTTHLGFTFARWNHIHAWTGWALIILILIHLALHIRWFLSIKKPC